MTKFALGVAIGYLFSDLIDDFLGRTTEENKTPEPPQPSPTPMPPASATNEGTVS